MNTPKDTRQPHMSSGTTSDFDAFFATRSRVIRLYNLPPMPESLLAAVFHPPANSKSSIAMPVPATMWELREGGDGGVWAVFKSHEEACLALTLAANALNVATARESDLEPFHKLKRFVLPLNSQPDIPTMLSASHNDLHYTISSNPPNPKSNFRFGDWICCQPNCAAHNFGRNVSCIGCGCPRSSTQQQQQSQTQQPISLANLAQHHQSTRPSPRFNTDPAMSPPMGTVYYSSAQPNQQQHLNTANTHEDSTRVRQQQHYQNHQAHTGSPVVASLPNQGTLPRSSSTVSHQQPPPPRVVAAAAAAGVPPKPTHPILTPSGRNFAVGGKVQNISSDPLSPCIMYWPDNEPFPEQGQIRPSNVVGVTQPPILNTGNRGPISHQPGDWICQKCNYLNWRRRKVCQTCLPYAEGNGDSISAAVQAERIALLTQVLSQTHLSGGPPVGVGHHAPQPTPGAYANANHNVNAHNVINNVNNGGNVSSAHHARSTTGKPSTPGGSGASASHLQLIAPSIAHRTGTLTPPQVRRGAPAASNLNSGVTLYSTGPTLDGLLAPPQQQHRTLQGSRSHGHLSSVADGHHHVGHNHNLLSVRSAERLHNPIVNSRAGGLDAFQPTATNAGSTPIYQTSGYGSGHAQAPNERHHQPSPLPQMYQHQYQQGRRGAAELQAPFVHHVRQPQPSRAQDAPQWEQFREPSPLYSTGPSNNFGSDFGGFNKVMGHNPAGNTSRVSLTSNTSSVPSFVSDSGSVSGSTNSAGSAGSSSRSSPVGLRLAPTPLLPSFLQDIVQSPALSPTSTTTVSSNADLSSLEDYSPDEYTAASDFAGIVGRTGHGRFTRPRVSSGSTTGSSDGAIGSVGSIWRFDGDESKSLKGGHLATATATPIQEAPQGRVGVIGAGIPTLGAMGRKPSREVFAAA